MLVFIDESGDAGLKLCSGSSEHFVVALVIFDDRSEAQRADNHVATIRRQLKVRPDFEFHFHKMKDDRRIIFLEEMAQFSFRYVCIVVNKAALSGPGFKYPATFYKYACKLVCNNAKNYLKEAKVIIDGSGSRAFKRQLATYLKKHSNDSSVPYRRIKDVRMEPAHKRNLLQLADMVAGSVARSYKVKKNRKRFRGILKDKETDVQLWPQKKSSNPILSARTPYGDCSG